MEVAEVREVGDREGIGLWLEVMVTNKRVEMLE